MNTFSIYTLHCQLMRQFPSYNGNHVFYTIIIFTFFIPNTKLYSPFNSCYVTFCLIKLFFLLFACFFTIMMNKDKYNGIANRYTDIVYNQITK